MMGMRWLNWWICDAGDPARYSCADMGVFVDGHSNICGLLRLRPYVVTAAVMPIWEGLDRNRS